MFNRNIIAILLIILIHSANAQEAIVINEICNNPPLEFDTEDWVELYNNGTSTVNLSGWQLKDDDDTHIFEFPNITIEPQGFLIICRELAAFESLRPGISGIGDMDFGFSSDGDCVRIFDASGQTVDEVCYEEEAPWPKANLGRTLGLKDPNLDNSVAGSWQLLGDNGTPGAENTFSGILSTPTAQQMEWVYPNPVTDETITIRLANPGIELTTTLINTEGKKIELKEIGERKDLALYHIPQGINNGLYFLSVKQKEQSYLKKIMIQR